MTNSQMLRRKKKQKRSKTEILPAIPSKIKMIFPGEHTPVRKALLHDTNYHAFEDIMSSSYKLYKIDRDGYSG